jgi:hypothetical protein
MKYHKHAKVIKAWANGAKIQWWNVEHRRWVDLDDSRPFSWDESIVYSVKPEEKKPDETHYLRETTKGFVKIKMPTYYLAKYSYEDLRAAVLTEREACAQLCEELGIKWHLSGEKVCAAAIRGRTK